MQCEEGQPIEDADRGRPVPLPFWQRIGPRAVALLALVGPAAAVFLTQHWHSRSELIQDLKKTQPATGYAIETTKAAPEVIPPAPGKSARARNKFCRIDADYSRHDRKSTAIGHRPASCFAINDETSWRDIRGLSRNHRG